MILGTTEEAIRRIESARDLPGDGSNFMSLSNVQRTIQVLPEYYWNEFFPNAHDIYSYGDFLRAVAKFPRFCEDAKDSNEEADLLEACKLELSTFLAHMKHESGALMHVTEIACTPAGQPRCDYSLSHDIYPPTDG